MATKSRVRKPKSREEVETDLEGVKTSSRSGGSAKEREQHEARNHAVREAVSGITADKVVQKVSAVGLDVTRMLAQASEQLVQTTQELENVREAVQVEKEELTRLYGVDVVGQALDVLLAQHEEKKATFEKELEDSETQWNLAQQAREKAQKEADVELKKTRDREKADYTYQFEQTKKTAEDNFKEFLRQATQNEKIRQEELTRTWAQREQALKDKEAEYNNAAKQIAEFPTVLKTEIGKAEAILGNVLKREHSFATQLLQKDFENKTGLLTSDLKNANDQLARANAQITSLQTQLANTDSKVQSIAEKALEAASGQGALAEIRGFTNRGDNGAAQKRS